MKQYHEILRELREDRDLKQSDIAKMLGTTQQYYSKYETGKFDLPVRYITLLADFYGVSTDFLLGRTRCKGGTAELKTTIISGYHADRMIADVLSLNAAGRAGVKDYIDLQLHVNKLK